MSTYQIPSGVVNDTKNEFVKPGMVAIWAGSTVPEGYLLCDGSAVSRTTYSALFSAIGTLHGVGDGSSTFNLPNFQGRYLKQGTVGTYGSESLPNITGTLGTSASVGGFFRPSPGVNGVFSLQATAKPYAVSYVADSSNNWGNVIFDASLSSSSYQDNAKVNPDNAEILYCIKY